MKSPTSFELSPRVFQNSPSIFLAFLSFFLASRLENLNGCYKIEITHLLQAIYSRFCEGCESKKCKLQGARAHARARAYNYRLINTGFYVVF